MTMTATETTTIARPTVRVAKPNRKERRVRIGLSRANITLMKARLLPRVCSEPWADAMFRTIVDRGPDGQRIEVTIFDASVYPPKADTCPMLVCAACGVPTPQPCVGWNGVCLDCHCAERPAQQQGYGGSSFARAMDAIRRQNLKLQELKLA
jgi:hypothetical protein